MFHTGFGSSRIAMSLRNFGKDQAPQDQGDRDLFRTAQPLVYTMALAGELFGHIGDPASLTAAFDLAHFVDYEVRYHVGAELWVQNTFALRGGYRFNYDLGDWTLGAGIHRKFGQRRIGVDVSYQNFGSRMDSPIRVALTGAM